MIQMRARGDFSKIELFLQTEKTRLRKTDFRKYGQRGVDALRAATPVDTGRTADSWYYEIRQDNQGITLSFNNSNIQNGVPIAVILEYGHGTGTGGWVEGRDYLSGALQPIFDQIMQDMQKEVESD